MNRFARFCIALPGRPGGRTLLTTLCLATLSLGAVPDADAQLLCLEAPLPPECQTFDFDVEITSLSDPFGIYGSALPGDVVSGSMTLYTGFPDLDPDPGEGFYLNAVECVRIDLGDRVMATLLQPVELTATPSPSDPGIGVLNDVASIAGPFTIFSDTATFLTAGPGIIDVDGVPTEADFSGGGGFAFGYGDTCISTVQTPCPPTTLVDEGVPAAPGDTTGLESALMSFDFLTTDNFAASAQTDILAIDPGTPLPCPEPALATSLLAGLASLALRGRRRPVRLPRIA